MGVTRFPDQGAIEALLRDLTPQVLGTVARRFRDFSAAEDAVQEASLAALVLHVLYLLFNEGYTTSSGDSLHRPDLSQEALRLTRILHDLQPDVPEVAGLLSLMLLTEARSGARTNAEGELIPLDHQDRSLWNQDLIAEGVALLSASLPRGAVGPYQLQAAIAAVHDEASRVEDTDWLQILALYDLLRQMSDNPMVLLNRVSPGTIGWTRSAPTCWSERGAGTRPSFTTASRQETRETLPSATTFSSKRPGFRPRNKRITRPNLSRIPARLRLPQGTAVRTNTPPRKGSQMSERNEARGGLKWTLAVAGAWLSLGTALGSVLWPSVPGLGGRIGILFRVTVQFAVNGGNLPDQAPKTLPPGVIPLVGWTGRLVVLASHAWVIVTAWQSLAVLKRISARAPISSKETKKPV